MITKRIRFDTALGHLLHVVFRGRLDKKVRGWYDKKYPTTTREGEDDIPYVTYPKPQPIPLCEAITGKGTQCQHTGASDHHHPNHILCSQHGYIAIRHPDKIKYVK